MRQYKHGTRKDAHSTLLQRIQLPNYNFLGLTLEGISKLNYIYTRRREGEILRNH